MAQDDNDTDWNASVRAAAERALAAAVESADAEVRSLARELEGLIEFLGGGAPAYPPPEGGELVDARAERIGKNEALFRRVNERLQEVGESFSLVAEAAEFVCECGDATCTESIRMTLDEYERLRASPAWFAIRPGHEIPDVETVVERRDGFDIVEKHLGGPAELAREEDPRS